MSEAGCRTRHGGTAPFTHAFGPSPSRPRSGNFGSRPRAPQVAVRPAPRKADEEKAHKQLAKIASRLMRHAAGSGGTGVLHGTEVRALLRARAEQFEPVRAYMQRSGMWPPESLLDRCDLTRAGELYVKEFMLVLGLERKLRRVFAKAVARTQADNEALAGAWRSRSSTARGGGRSWDQVGAEAEAGVLLGLLHPAHPQLVAELELRSGGDLCSRLRRVQRQLGQ